VGHLITKANARQMAAKSHAAKAERLQQLRQAIESVADPAANDEFRTACQSRVRVQLNLVNAALLRELQAKTVDAQAVDRLAAAQMRLSEQLRILEGQPLPGSRRPAPDRTRRQSGQQQVGGSAFKFPT